VIGGGSGELLGSIVYPQIKCAQALFLTRVFSSAHLLVINCIVLPILAFLVSGRFAPPIHFKYSFRCAGVQSAKHSANPALFNASAIS